MLSLLTLRVPRLAGQTAAHYHFEKARRRLGLKTVDQGLRTPWGTLRGNRGFRWYFFGSVTSDFGTWLQNTAQVILAYQLAHSVLAVGCVTFAQFTSPLVLSPWAGVAADRFGSRRTLLATLVVSAGTAAALAVADFAGLLNIWVLAVGATLTGLAFTFALPARNITVQRLVRPDKLKPAYVMDSVSYNIGRTVAPVLTMGMLWTGINLAWAFTLNALSFIAFGVTLWRVHMHAEPEAARRSRVRDGFVIAGRDRRILFLLLMVAAVTVADDPILVLGPALARHLHVSPAWCGWFIASLGAGSVFGSFRPSKHEPQMRLAATALAALALFMLLFVHAPTMWIGVLAALGAGASCLIANSVTRAALARHAGPEHSAAVMAVWAIAWAGSKPFASLLDGALGSSIGLQWTGLILAAPALIPFLIIMLEPKLGFWSQNLRVNPAGALATGNARG